MGIAKDMRSFLIVMMCTLPLEALADDASPGLWQETGYREDETGKRTDCSNEGCFPFPKRPGQGLTCASGPDLRAYAKQHLADLLKALRGRLKNCGDTAAGGIKCDGLSAATTISSPDATHVSFSYTVEGLGRLTKRVWRYERLGDNCSAATGVIRSDVGRNPSPP